VPPDISYSAVSIIEIDGCSIPLHHRPYSSAWLQTLRFRRSKWGKTDHEMSITEFDRASDAQTQTYLSIIRHFIPRFSLDLTPVSNGHHADACVSTAMFRTWGKRILLTWAKSVCHLHIFALSSFSHECKFRVKNSAHWKLINFNWNVQGYTLAVN
jgi:hypothetical protein